MVAVIVLIGVVTLPLGQHRHRAAVARYRSTVVLPARLEVLNKALADAHRKGTVVRNVT